MKTRQLHQALQCGVGSGRRRRPLFRRRGARGALAKTDPARQGTVLHTTAEVIRQVRDPGASPSCRNRPGRMLDPALRSRPISATSAALGGGPPASRGESKTAGAGGGVFRVTSSRQRRRGVEHARRQPLPPGFSRLRRRPRRDHRSRRGRAGGRAHGHDLDPGAPSSIAWLAITERFSNVYCSVGTHPPQCTRGAGPHRRGSRGAQPEPQTWSPSARPGSTITMISARATPRRTGFRRHIAAGARETRPAARHPFPAEADADMAAHP